MKALSAAMQPNEAYRGLMQSLIAAMQPNEAYRDLMKLNQAHQRRNAEALQLANSLYEKQAQTIKSKSLFLYKVKPYIQLLTT